MFLCLVAFGFDMYFVYIYIHHSEVVFGWRFYTETSVIGTLFWIIFLSELFYRISNHLKKRRRYEYDYAHHAPYLPATLPSTHHQHVSSSPNTFPNKTAVEPEEGVIVPYERQTRSCCRTFWSAMRFISVWLISAALLNVSITSFQHQTRSVFALPFARDSAQGDSLNEKYSGYEPHDLFNCPDVNISDYLTTLCQFNQLVMTLSALIGLITVFEGLATVIFENRKHPSSSRRPQMKKRAEHYDLAEMGNAHVIVPIQSPHPVSDPNPYSDIHNENSFANKGDHNLDERPLPSLPPRSENENELAKEQVDDNAYAAVVSNTENVGFNPFEKEKEHTWVDEKVIDYSNQGEESIAGPSNTYPADIKRTDGL
ncbi:hypothetical protein BGZ46_007801 [Entomortierella lignicola]|nr:hypothetical protein BGZ46_007801 [Entomortierella lignicola]